MGGRAVIDFETRSLLDLKKVGAPRYAADPSTDVGCVAYAIDDGPVELWVRGDPPPEHIIVAAIDPDVLFVAHNAAFERAILRHVLAPRYGWPNIPIARWRCTMAASLALALPAGLAKVAAVLGLPQLKADKKIATLMAKPRRPRGDEDPAAGPYWFDDPEHLQALYEYCRQDVETTRELYRRLPPLLPAEQELWQLDQAIGDRGFYVDGKLIEKMIAVTTTAERAVQAELQQIIGDDEIKTTKVDKLQAWLAAHGCVVEDLQKGTLSQALRRTSLTPEVRRVIELRREAAHASAGKASSLQAWRCHDGRVRAALKFHAAATGRWAGSGPQPQNFRRETEATEAKVAAVMTGDIETVRQLGPPIEVIGDIARATICAPPGSRLLIGDFSGIESRVLAWIADQHDKVKLWETFDRTQDPNDDPYVVIGRSLGHPEATARQKGKIADLAFGYQGGAGAYKNFAPENDTASDADIQRYKQTWRAKHPQIEQFWWGIDRAAVKAVSYPTRAVPYGRLTLHCERQGDATFLYITLPSGRRLAYPFVQLMTNRFNRAAVTFMDNALATGGWTACNHGQGAYGGLWVENVVSGIARDLLAAAMTRLEAAGYPIVLHVHDEIVCELPGKEGNTEEFKDLLQRCPEWAK